MTVQLAKEHATHRDGPELQESSTVHDPRQRRQILVATCLALMAVVASASGLNVAQQELATTFGASQSMVVWFVNVYIVVLAATLMPIGAIGDRWGRRPVLLAGLVLFGFASVGGAFARSATFMLVSRGAAGLAAAMIMPVTLSVITSSFPASERSRAIGVWSGVAGAGGLLGMITSAAVIDLVDWRWLFALPVVLALAALVVTLRAVPNSHEHHGRFDLGGSILSMFAVGGLVFAIHHGPVHGWQEPFTLALLVLGVLATLGFVWWELRHRFPLLDVRMFGDRALATGSIALLSMFGVLAGVFIVLFPFFQAVLGWSALVSTAGLLPMAMTMMIASGLAHRLSKRTGVRLTMLAGIATATLGLGAIASLVSIDGGYVSVLPGMLLVGIGMGITMPPSTEAITSALPADKQGVASALNDSTREFGSALGVALLGAVLSSGYRDSIAPHVTRLPPDIANAASAGIGTAMSVAARLGPDADVLVRASQQAFIDGWARSVWITVGIMAALFLYVVLRGPTSATMNAAAA